MKKNRLLVTTACFALLQSPTARSDSDTVMAVLQHQIASITELGAVQSAITAMIEKMTNAAMELGHSDAQKEIVAQGVVGDGLSQTAIDVFNQETVFWMTPDVGTCNRKTAKADIDTASKQQEKLRAQLNAAVATRVRGSSGGSGKINTLKVHDTNFCAQSDVDRKYCNSVSEYADFDLSAANFMQPKNNTYDPTEKKAAAQFIVNTTAPTPLRMPQLNHSTSSIEMQMLREAHNAYAARLSTANESLADVLADNAVPDSAAPGSKGIFQLIKEQVEGRAMGEGGAAFTTALTKGGPGTAARSTAEMESMTNLLLLKLWESDRRQQVIQGEILSVLTHMAMEHQVLSRSQSVNDTENPKN
ncbi:MAG: hypothetical protein ACXV8Q_00275 [Methylobacter sp.]